MQAFSSQIMQPSRKRGVVCLENGVTKKVADAELPHFAAQEQVSEEHSLQVQVGDLAYATNRSFVKLLNEHLEKRKSVEGDFYDVTEVAARLKHLQKKGKTDKAQKFREDLESFANEFGISFEAFTQWQAVMDCKDVRDRFAHPVQRFGIDSLRDALSKNVAVLEPCKDAVSAMIVIGQRFKIFTGGSLGSA
ncbi:hypothetical protein PLESTB_001819500 [Pleodorina starrii]|uniref:Uncharacterized protein n=1 Tax=Pleodorina starrii TaxID=330485 RepID=A0A9W6FAL2_9CHLO|nr:hypothetical protein PLESTM_000969100 [Pleodorina starrii]GLC61920.1 hypothetical protein PLESTB_001819500 [Pleodorina starrii]GLC76702.1 hypothetical protein PLESTF_001820000 [Pleodorina starrii]